MTDRTDNLNPEDELHPEDRAIEQALSQAMATGAETRLLRGGDGADATLVREYSELLGLLPYELPAETPAASVRELLMARVGGAPAAEAPAVAAFPQPVTATRPAWGTWAMAAVLALCLVGLGFLSSLVWQQSQQIDQLSRLAVSTGPLLAAPEQSEVLRVREQVHTLQSRLDMITTVAQEAYPLRMVGQTTSPNQPRGVVYVCGRHQQWYLNLRGLEPVAVGEEYRLWFMTDQGKVDGGILEVRSDATSEREALAMPAGTHGFAVTLERQGPRDEPESLTILLGENAVKL